MVCLRVRSLDHCSFSSRCLFRSPHSGFYYVLYSAFEHVTFSFYEAVFYLFSTIICLRHEVIDLIYIHPHFKQKSSQIFEIVTITHDQTIMSNLSYCVLNL